MPDEQNNPAGNFDPAIDGRTIEPIPNASPCGFVTLRKSQALEYRQSEANRACGRDPQPVKNRNNGEEDELRNPTTRELSYAANYTKGMPLHPTDSDAHELGEVDPEAYMALLTAVNTEDPLDFEAIPNGPDQQIGPAVEVRPYVDPQAGIAFDLEGPDPPSSAIFDELLEPELVRLAPTFDSDEFASEMGEVYWMALLRDVPFNEFSGSTTANQDIEQAVNSLNQFSDFRGPKVGGQVTPQTLFRGSFAGDLTGPYLSQFLVIGNRADSPPPQFTGGKSGDADTGSTGLSLQRTDGLVLYGTVALDQRLFEIEPGLDFMTDYDTWLSIQTGVSPAEENQFTGNRRFIYSPRQLANYVHFDQTYQEYLIAALLIIGMQERADATKQDLFGAGNPYLPQNSENQMGFGTFGNGHVLALLAEATTRAIKAAWNGKWFNQRRLRSEASGGRIHNVAAEEAAATRYGINEEISLQEQPGANILLRIYSLNEAQNNQNPNRPDGGTFLLPQAYPEGSPLHPAYPAGHATQAGACVTILKALFNEGFTITGPRGETDSDPVLEPNADGTALVEYTPPQGELMPELTILGELNKLAANVALGRNMAGVHYRTDYEQSLRLGEYVAVGILQEQARSFNNKAHFFELTLFSGIKIRIKYNGVIEIISQPS